MALGFRAALGSAALDLPSQFAAYTHATGRSRATGWLSTTTALRRRGVGPADRGTTRTGIDASTTASTEKGTSHPIIPQKARLSPFLCSIAKIIWYGSLAVGFSLYVGLGVFVGVYMLALTLREAFGDAYVGVVVFFCILIWAGKRCGWHIPG
jgi:hypothetical protein